MSSSEKKTSSSSASEDDDDETRRELMAQKSIRQLPKMRVKEDENGEALQECTDGEWDASDEPFSAELLNVKNAPNKVSVFSGPCRSKETAIEKVTKTKATATTPSAPPPPSDDRPERLAGVMSRFFNELIDASADASRVKVTISASRK